MLRFVLAILLSITGATSGFACGGQSLNLPHTTASYTLRTIDKSPPEKEPAKMTTEEVTAYLGRSNQLRCGASLPLAGYKSLHSSLEAVLAVDQILDHGWRVALARATTGGEWLTFVNIVEDIDEAKIIQLLEVVKTPYALDEDGTLLRLTHNDAGELINTEQLYTPPVE